MKKNAIYREVIVMRASVWRTNSHLTSISFLLGLIVSLPAIVAAEQLPVRTYTTADGLPRDLIHRIVQDSVDANS